MWETNTTRLTKRKFLDIKNINHVAVEDGLKSLASHINTLIEKNPDINQVWFSLRTGITKLVEDHIPLRLTKAKQKPLLSRWELQANLQLHCQKRSSSAGTNHLVDQKGVKIFEPAGIAHISTQLLHRFSHKMITHYHN